MLVHVQSHNLGLNYEKAQQSGINRALLWEEWRKRGLMWHKLVKVVFRSLLISTPRPLLRSNAPHYLFYFADFGCFHSEA
jgi:hypothetical protein